MGRISFLFQLALLGAAISSTAHAAEPSADSYDYVVVGSGPGGGPLACNLARAGYSTLLIEAGDDQSADLATVLANLPPGAGGNPALRWGFFVKHYSDQALQNTHNHLTWRLQDGSYWVSNATMAPPGAELLGVFYPRGATLGGSSIINAMATWLPSDSDWDNIMNITGDKSWSHDNMRNIFSRIENNNYLKEGTPGHGFDGYFETNLGDGSQWPLAPQMLDVMRTQVKSIGDDPNKIVDYLSRDGNYLSPTRDQDQGMYGLPFHADDRWARFSSRTYILDTLAAKKPDGSQKYPLTLSANSLATKLIWKEDAKCKPKQPRVVGVEVLKGVAQYRADSRYDSTKKGQTKEFYAKREVIVSGGTFNSPQLLQLSGIGDAKHLESLGIELKVNLPGVGRNLMDNQEVPIAGLAQQNFTIEPAPGDPVCQFGAANDPCLEAWKQVKGPYTRQGANGNALLLKSKHAAYDERDIFIFTIPGLFRGFWPETGTLADNPDPRNAMGMSMVKIHPQNHAGYVKVRSSDPTEPPEINFELYHDGADVDLGAMQDTIAWGRRVYASVPAPLGPMSVYEPPCPQTPADGYCGDVDRDWIKQETFGHHPTSTCSMGPKDDPMAVVGGDFRVHGTKGLRVVDASVFPRTPGPFPVLPTFMISQKAADAILGELAQAAWDEDD